MAAIILKMAMLVSRTADSLEKDIAYMDVPTWVNSCLDERDGQIDLQALESVKVDSLELVDTLRGFEYLAKAQFSLVMIIAGLPLLVLILNCLGLGLGCSLENCEDIPT